MKSRVMKDKLPQTYGSDFLPDLFLAPELRSMASSLFALKVNFLFVLRRSLEKSHQGCDDRFLNICVPACTARS